MITLTNSKSLTASLTASLAAIALTAAAALLLAGCGGSDESGDIASSSPATSNSTAVPEMSDRQDPPERLVVDVTISGREVTPTNEQLQAKVGDPIVVRINSDAADQLHVDSNPEHTFDIQPKSGQSFQFTVVAPGEVNVELRRLKRTIASISVQ